MEFWTEDSEDIWPIMPKAQDKWDPSESSSFAHNGEKIIDHKIDHYLSLTFNNKIVEFFNCMKNALLWQSENYFYNFK